MPKVELTATALQRIESIIDTHELPADTLERVLRSLEPLEHFPLAGRSLRDQWDGFRLVLGPWPWMLLLYQYDEAEDQVLVVTAQDARQGSSATSLG